VIIAEGAPSRSVLVWRPFERGLHHWHPHRPVIQRVGYDYLLLVSRATAHGARPGSSSVCSPPDYSRWPGKLTGEPTRNERPACIPPRRYARVSNSEPTNEATRSPICIRDGSAVVRRPAGRTRPQRRALRAPAPGPGVSRPEKRIRKLHGLASTARPPVTSATTIHNAGRIPMSTTETELAFAGGSPIGGHATPNKARPQKPLPQKQLSSSHLYAGLPSW